MGKHFAAAAVTSLVVLFAAPVGAKTPSTVLVPALTADRVTVSDSLAGEAVYGDKGRGAGSIAEVLPHYRSEPTVTAGRIQLADASANNKNWLQGGGG